MPVKSVLFDKDGVLVDFHRTWGLASRDVIETLADGDHAIALALANASEFDLKTATYSSNAAFIAGSGADTLLAWDPILGTMRNPQLCRQIFSLFTEKGLAHVTGAPALVETLDRLRRAALPLGIATNDMEESARAQAEKLNVKDHFASIMGADSGHGAKPGPGMLLAFASACAIEPSEMVMVGDTLHDLHAAKAAGVIGVAIGTGPADLETLAPEADYAISDLSELPTLVARL